MSAHFHGSTFHSRHRPSRPGTLDLDTTTDVHEENTADLDPTTADIVPSEVPRPTTLATTPPQPVPQETPSGRREPYVSSPVVAAPATALTVDVARRDEPVRDEPVRAFSPVGSTTADIPLRVVPTTVATPMTVDVLPADTKVDSIDAASSLRKPVPLKAVDSNRQRPAWAPGTVLCDRYLLEQIVGCGGTAIVFRARDMLSGKGSAPNLQVAVKTPRPELGDPARAAKRLKHEFEHAKLLSHPSIVRVLDLQEDDGRTFMTMELVQGKLLSQLLRDWTVMPKALAHKVLRLCAEALQYAHSQNVVHGDFKPGNVFITPEEGVCIVDFGTAAGPSANESRIPAGTPTYASPEVLSGEMPDARDDVFSFACVAYELLTGQHPFGRQSSLQARDEGKIPPRAWNLSTSQWISLLSALSWKREQRPTSVEELLTRLNTEPAVAAASAPIHIDPEEVVPAELPADLMPKQRSWGFFAFIVCALLVTYFAFQRRNAPDNDGAPVPTIAVPATATLPVAPEPAAAAATSEQPVDAPTTEETAPAATAAPTQAAPAAAKRPAAAPTSEIAFENLSIVTSETSVAAVFLIKRSQPLSGRVNVSWKAVSGTADAGIDFASSASGTVTFADGQAQRAIYVPLRNDLIKEDDEVFYVDLIAPKSARVGKSARAEAIIRDDD